MEYAEHQFRMSDDMSLAEMDPPRLEYIWRWFNELSDCREIGMAQGAIQHQEILAWSTLRGIGITAAEVSALRLVDRAYLAYCYAKNNPDKRQSISQSLADVAEQAKMRKEIENARAVRKTNISRK